MNMSIEMTGGKVWLESSSAKAANASWVMVTSTVPSSFTMTSRIPKSSRSLVCPSSSAPTKPATGATSAKVSKQARIRLNL